MGTFNRAVPSLAKRLESVFHRHYRVYTENLWSNGFPAFLEPLIFLAGVGLGLGKYIPAMMGGMRYVEYLGTGIVVSAAMWTAAFECSFGTFIRLEFEKIYDGMLAAPLTVNNLITGEIIWSGVKGAFYSSAVLVVLLAFGIGHLRYVFFVPIVGFVTGVMFAALSLYVTSFVKNINHFNFYITGFISPILFLSDIVFPISDLPRWLRPLAELVPLTHPVRLTRAACAMRFDSLLLFDVLYIVFFIILFGSLAINRLEKRLID
jgi:lipooligosaccharide transport system permease protein